MKRGKHFWILVLVIIVQTLFAGCQNNETARSEKPNMDIEKAAKEENLNQKGAKDGESHIGTSDLEIFSKGYPRAFFFRPSESKARREPPYEQWEAEFIQLNGIMGKVLDEEIADTSKTNIEYFTRYKNANPEKAVFLHYNGKVRRPEDGRPLKKNNFFLWPPDFPYKKELEMTRFK